MTSPKLRGLAPVAPAVGVAGSRGGNGGNSEGNDRGTARDVVGRVREFAD